MARDTLVSLDIGNGYVKARGPNGGWSSFPSVLATLNENMDGFDFPLGSNEKFVIGYRGLKYAVGDTVHFEGLTPVTIAHRSRIQTEFYRVLFAAALSEVVPDNADVHVVVSLPPAAYWDKDAQKAVISGLYEVQKVTRGGSIRTFQYDVNAQNVRVIPEGVGSICTMALTEDGKEQTNSFLAKTPVGVVDVGTYTTDLIHLDSLRIVRSGCDTMTTALHDIHERLRSYVSSNGVDLSTARADTVLHDGFFLKGGKRVSIASELDVWFSELSQAISAQIRTTWNGGNDVESIIVTGGGAPWVEKILAMEFPHVRMIKGVQPFFANCEGGYRYGLLRERAEKVRGR